MPPPRLPSDPTSLERLLVELHGRTGENRDTVDLLRLLGDPAEAIAPRVAPPGWLAKATAEFIGHLAQRWTQRNIFTSIRALERLNLVTLEHDDTYVLAMVCGLGDRWDGAVRATAIRADQEIRETLIWRVFEVEGGGEVSLANVDKYSRPEAGWAQTFRDLVADATLPRDRVLAGCLSALGRDFSAYRAGWFTQLHRSLAPTVEELIATQAALMGLLRSPIPATVAFAVRYLALLDKARGLDDEVYADRFAPALAVPGKATVLSALSLAARVAGRRPDLAPAVVEAIALGLEHPQRDVQERALEILRSLDARLAVESRVDLLEPSVRRLAGEWLDLAAAAPPPAPPALGPAPANVSTVETSLAERAAALLAGSTEADAVERLLAGLVTTPDVAAQLAPLRKQAQKVIANPRTSGTLRRPLAQVVLAAIGEAGPAPGHGLHGDLLSARLAEVVEALAGRRDRYPLLATPTDPAGWLDPSVFVVRLTTVDDPAHNDVIAALLRLAIDGRPAALAAATAVPGELGEAVRYALGGPPGTIVNRSLWVAAARSRAPLDPDPLLQQAGLTGAGDGYPAALGLRLRPDTSLYEERGRTRTITWWRPSLIAHPASGPEHADRPTVVAAHENLGHAGFAETISSDWIAWSATIWPHDAEPLFARTFFELWYSAGAYPFVTYGIEATLAALTTHPGRLGPMAAATLAAGLAAQELRHRAHAADAFAALVPSGRLPASELIAMMATLAPHCPANRWSTALRDAASVGPQAALSVVDVLTGLLPTLDPQHGRLVGLLETLHEESLRVGLVPTDPALRTWLASLGGSGKSAKVARELLAEGAAR